MRWWWWWWWWRRRSALDCSAIEEEEEDDDDEEEEEMMNMMMMMLNMMRWWWWLATHRYRTHVDATCDFAWHRWKKFCYCKYLASLDNKTVHQTVISPRTALRTAGTVMTSNAWYKYLFILWKSYTLLKQHYLAITASQYMILQSFTRPGYVWAACTWTWNR